MIGTGGLAEIFAPLCRSFDAVDPYLTLYGLSLAFELLGASAARALGGRIRKYLSPQHLRPGGHIRAPLLHAPSALT